MPPVLEESVRPPVRKVGIGNDVALAERARDRVDAEAVVRELDLLHLGAELAEDRERAVAARRLHEREPDCTK